MISVQNRLPEPGKENRVSITPDNGSAVEGVLAYADDATQEGTFWNRKTAQLLQGDIRTYPVREGQSIAAGDVVNVGRELLSGSEQTYGDLPVGSTIQINENGSPVDYLVVHQGNPDPDLYDASCDGTWLLRKDIAENRVWDAGDSNQYADSDINDYLNGDWLDRYDSTTLSNIKQVKIPYFVGGGSSTVNSGANGLSVKAFLIGAYEIGLTTADSSVYPEDGGKLDYFISGMSSSAKNKRIANYEGGIASGYYTRSARTDNNDIHIVAADATMAVGQASHVTGIRPCIIISSSSFIGDAPVYGPETVYKDVVPQDNVETKISTYAVTNTDIIKLNQSYSVVGYTLQNNGGHCTLLSNEDNSIVTPIALNAGENISSVSLARLDDSHFVVQFQVGNGLYSKIGTVSGNSITLGNDRVIDQPLSNTDRNNAILSLSQSFALSIYNSSGIQAKVLTISGNQIPTVSAAYSLSSNTGANYISACRLPDDASGNKRVCICFADTGDSNKGKAVIATISADNAVTFGDVVTVRNSGPSYPSCVADDDNVFALIGDSTTGSNYVYKLTVSESDIISVSDPLTITNTLGDQRSSPVGAIQLVGDAIVILCVMSIGTSDNCAFATCVDKNLSAQGSVFKFNPDTVNYISSANISDDKLIVAYADGNNSSYGTTTILEVSGNQIAGSFIDNSKDAIALADGTGGQEIPVGFGGYCECPGVTEGQTIDSLGVIAEAVQDGWLQIKSAWDKEYVLGEYVGTGMSGSQNPVVIDLGFKPSFFAIGGNGYPQGYAVRGMESFIPLFNINQRCYIDWLDTGVSLHSLDGESAQFNSTGNTYYYIAWR